MQEQAIQSYFKNFKEHNLKSLSLNPPSPWKVLIFKPLSFDVWPKKLLLGVDWISLLITDFAKKVVLITFNILFTILQFPILHLITFWNMTSFTIKNTISIIIILKSLLLLSFTTAENSSNQLTAALFATAVIYLSIHPYSWISIYQLISCLQTMKLRSIHLKINSI